MICPSACTVRPLSWEMVKGLRPTGTRTSAYLRPASVSTLITDDGAKVLGIGSIFLAVKDDGRRVWLLGALVSPGLPE